jgi:hypothetical protein
MKILVQQRNVYGNTLIYPICEKAKVFAELTGHKTLSLGNLKSIKNLGYKVEEAQNLIKLFI